MTNKNKKHVHIVGICGVTMAPLAVLYKSMGWKVTGSDRAFFPPMSVYLERNNISIMPGYKEEHMDSRPNLVLVMAFITENNPEIKAAKKMKIPIKSYGEVLPYLIEKQNSIIIAGDCGKTSTTALISWVLDRAGYNPSFMIGGLPCNFDHGIRSTNSTWSVVEGDEYVLSSWDATPRFLSYNPKYLVLTDIQWDHMDKFPTEAEYINIFKELVKKVPRNGLIIANRDGWNISKVIKYSKAPVLQYTSKEADAYPLPLKGDIWRQNSSAAITLAKHLGIEDKILKESFASFGGIKRRQEICFNKDGIAIVDDNAHTPTKVSGALQAISETLPGYKLWAIYEPGNRSELALGQSGYGKCFKLADSIILPRISTANSDSKDFSKKLASMLGKHYRNCQYITKDSDVITAIKEKAVSEKTKGSKIAFVFMSQKGFRGMIGEAITSLPQ